MTYTKIKFYIILILKKNPRLNNKKITKRVLGIPLLFLYKLSIVVLIDFIAILLTPGIFLIQIDITNMYVINFYNKNNICQLARCFTFNVSGNVYFNELHTFLFLKLNESFHLSYLNLVSLHNFFRYYV